MRRTPAATPLSSVIDEQADVAGGADVRAAAQLHAEARDRHDAHAIAVLLAEQRHRARRDRLLGRLHLGLTTGVLRKICSLTIRSISLELLAR